MRQGQTVKVKVDAIPNVEYEGRIASISDATVPFIHLFPKIIRLVLRQSRTTYSGTYRIHGE